MKKVLIVFLVLLLMACGSVPSKYDPSTISSPIKSITTTNRDGGFFLVDYVNPDTGKVVYDFGLSDISGRSLISKYDLINPRDEIKDNLADKIAKSLNISVTKSDKRISFHTDKETLDNIPKVYSNGDLILDITTKNWVLRYKLGKYQLHFGAESRLFERATNKLLVVNSCQLSKDESGKYIERKLFENNAALLKKEIRRLSEICANQLHETIF